MRLVYTPEAIAQLEELSAFIEKRASPATADAYIDSLMTFCDGLSVFPERRRLREDIRPGLRVVSFRKRTVIAFARVEDDLVVLGIFHGGRDYEGLLTAPEIE